MTNREIFDRVKAHLLKQGRRSLLPGSNYRCAYRGEGGLSCAIGCLISDEAYSPYLENKATNDTPVLQALINSGLNNEEALTLNLLRDLQIIHDQEMVGDWPYHLDKLERDYFGCNE